MFVTSTAFLILVDGAKQVGPVGCSGIFQSKLHSKNFFFQPEYLGAYVHIVLFTFGNIFYLAIIILLYLLPTGGYCLANIAKLILFLSYKYKIYFSIELDLFIYLGFCYG